MRNNLPAGAQPWAKQVSKTLDKDRRKLSRNEANKRANQVNIAVGGARLAKVDTNEADNRSNETRLEDLEGSLGGTIEGFDDILNNEEYGVIPMVEWQKEHQEEVDILVGELQDNYNDVVDPFIRDTENAINVELPEAIDRSKDAQEKALEALTKYSESATDTKMQFAVSSSPTDPPTSGWSYSTPTVPAGSYSWMRAEITYGNGDVSYSAPVRTQGDPGAKGSDGVAGKDGVGLESTAVTYAKSTSGTTAPTTGWGSSVPSSTPGQYLWTRTIWTYSDGSSETGYSVAMWGATGSTGASGKDGVAGKDGVGIKTTVINYAKSTSGTTTPTTGWGTTVPAATPGQYLWTRTVWTYTDNTTETGYSVAMWGTAGAKGDTGAQGISVTSVTPYYKAAATKPSEPTGASPAGWSTEAPLPGPGENLYRSERVAYSNGQYSWTPVTVDQALYVANFAQQAAEGLITIGNEPPAHGPGKIWMQTGDFVNENDEVVENQLIGIWQSVDNSWQSYTLMAGTFIVPGEDGIPTVIDGNGVVTGHVAANSITGKVIQADSVGAEVFIAGTITKGTEENPGPLGADVKGTLNDAEEWANRVVIDPESITISRSPVGSGQLTALRLEATKLDFVVSGNSVAHIDAEKNFMSIGNAYIRESIQVGEHQIKKNGSGITTFQWTGA